MALERGIVICSFGEREKYLTTTINSLRKAGINYPIKLITDKIRYRFENVHHVEIPQDLLLWKDSSRWPIRNTNLLLAKHAIYENFDTICCLNDDMYICNKGFLDGFTMAERFGVCVPTNPRIYVKYNAMGADTTEADKKIVDEGPIYGPACNVSPMFVCRLLNHATRLVQVYIEELQTCMRGTLAFWLASFKTGITPVYLPEQWCICESNAKYFRDYKKVLQGRTYNIEPVVLHIGQKGVVEIFKGLYNDLDI